MKTLVPLLILLMLAGSSCKTTEANYRAAYEAAVAGREDNSGIDNTVYDKIRREAIPATVITYTGDTIPARRERVRVTEPSSPSAASLQEAYVVVSQFKQIFNAHSLVERLEQDGYPDALILETAEPLYYVSIGGGTTHEAALLLKKYLADPVIPAKSPYPLIVQPAR